MPPAKPAQRCADTLRAQLATVTAQAEAVQGTYQEQRKAVAAMQSKLNQARKDAGQAREDATILHVQVGIEVKNANMGWTVTQLERAISNQLAHDYLRTENRRHGILVVSLHKPKTWRVAGKVWDFDQIIAHLQAFAAETKSNRTGTIEVRAMGINACPPRPTQHHRATVKERKVRSKATAKKIGNLQSGGEEFRTSALPALDTGDGLF